MANDTTTGTKPATPLVIAVPNGPSAEDAFRMLRDRPFPFFLDSAMVNPRFGRYSFVGAEPFLVIQSKGKSIVVEHEGNRREFYGNPFAELREILAEYRASATNTPVPFCAGAVGFLSYDLQHFVERLPDTTVDDIKFPEMYFALYDAVAGFDLVEKRCYVTGADVRGTGETALQRKMDELLETLCRAAERSVAAEPFRPSGNPPALRGNFTRREYCDAVQRAKDYIAAGDIFQVNLSQRFQTQIEIPPAVLYDRLRAINPAPFAAYIGMDNLAVVSSSPERFLRVDGRYVQTRPIKGTRPRGHTPADDETMKRELLESEKDAAELTMIVDLERNDLGRVCAYGSVRVTERKTLEAYPTVYHLVGTVEGELHERYDLIDLLKATFPGGSITGAPKIRAMEIIDEIEPTKRSVYTGAIGYIGFDGRADLNIAIRTLLVRDSEVFLQVGGGIVADSTLEGEYEETLDKARALFASLGVRR